MSAIEVEAGATVAHLKRLAKEEALRAWTKRWSSTKPSRRFAPANRMTPSWKLKKHFKKLPRKLYGRTLQCRTGHAFIGEYYADFVQSEATDCLCGEHFQ
ncbi:hypothetical protein SISSUDRAFT_1064721 [Sistotremastrum suecicum HHB10207 ss-3]|uniref:Uncharacterized protein n=1 Tax=Sistotremastrum suecicum HHB10207 ss-3 TaxID=1314776 RepID=A0A166A9Z6_9AGAM|nr:hypothetical protein SISSUDRAFT_1064721 [Sistotremastrum suecicum HHB10207 ss-3]